jgi:hypothetical protein
MNETPLDTLRFADIACRSYAARENPEPHHADRCRVCGSTVVEHEMAEIIRRLTALLVAQAAEAE